MANEVTDGRRITASNVENAGAAIVLGTIGGQAAAAVTDPIKLPKLLAPTENEPDPPHHGIDARHIYDYKTFDRLGDDPDVDVVYIVLPNGPQERSATHLKSGSPDGHPYR